MKKILFILFAISSFSFFISCLIGICTVFPHVQFFFDVLDNNSIFYEETVIPCFLICIFGLFFSAISTMLTILILFNKTTFLFDIKYTYEEYKEKRDKQKLQKQAEDKQKKIENLKQQLSDLENTD